MMTAWVRKLAPDASDEQLIAARAHHLRRWAIPRDDYPRDRAGLPAVAHGPAPPARRRGRPRSCGAPATTTTTIARVQAIVRKEGLGRDPEVQVHEDALCLVFLETQFDELAAQRRRREDDRDPAEDGGEDEPGGPGGGRHAAALASGAALLGRALGAA